MDSAVRYGDRWERVGLLGTGGQGYVFRVRDVISGREAALKLLRGTTEAQRARVRREIQALRMLQLPGVVPLIDVGEHEGTPFLVMQLLTGSPFPGRGVERSWGTIAPRLRLLVETLAHVHAVGIVHRDLKPENVLVDDDGNVTILDFGLARGGELAATVTAADGFPVGTPRYLAPEQAFGEPVDARADLYAVGVMVYEALVGRPPQPDTEFARRWVHRVWPPPPPLAELDAGIDPGVSALITQLLAREPTARPSAQALLVALRDRVAYDTLSRPTRLPLLARESARLELLADARCGVSRDVWGPPGSGRTRLLREVAEQLGREGRDVLWLAGKARPLQELAARLGPEESPPTGLDAIAGRLRERLAEGLVLVIDDVRGLGARGREVVERARSAGAILRVHDSPDAVRLGPIPAAELQALFHGPDRVFHLREDAAAELHTRTGGLAARVVAELDAWIGAGLARWDEGRVRVDRPVLDRLASGLRTGGAGSWTGGTDVALEPALADLLVWLVLGGGALTGTTLATAAGLPGWEVDLDVAELLGLGLIRERVGGALEALHAPARVHEIGEPEVVRRHRAIAAVLPAGEARLRQWLLADAGAELIAEGVPFAERALAEGRSATAVTWFERIWETVRAEPEPPEAARIATRFAAAALESGTPEHTAAALAALRACAEPAVAPVRALVEARLSANRGDLGAALVTLAPVGPLTDVDLELHRLGLRVRGAIARQSEPLEALLAGLADHPDARVRSRHRHWSALAAYEREEFARAADLHAEAARLDPSPRWSLVCAVNEGSARLDALEPERVLELGRRVVAGAAALRAAQLEAWGWTLVHSGEYRLTASTTASAEWPAVSRATGPVQRHAHAMLIVAAAAWRAGRIEESAERAAEADRCFTAAGSPIAVLPRCLRLNVLPEAPMPPGMVEAIAALPHPRLALQAALLLHTRIADSGLDHPPLDALIRTLTERIGAPPSGRLDVLDLREALA